MDIDVSKISLSGKYQATYNNKIIEVGKFPKNRGQMITIALDNLIARDGAKCRKCFETRFLSIEHIVPEWILKQLFVSLEELYIDLDNLEILCRFCNQAKSGQLDFSNPKTKIILLKYINKI